MSKTNRPIWDGKATKLIGFIFAREEPQRLQCRGTAVGRTRDLRKHMRLAAMVPTARLPPPGDKAMVEGGPRFRSIWVESIELALTDSVYLLECFLVDIALTLLLVRC